MRVAIVSGSPRKDSNSLKTCRYIEHRLGQSRDVTSWVLDLAATELPGWTEPESPAATAAAGGELTLVSVCTSAAAQISAATHVAPFT